MVVRLVHRHWINFRHNYTPLINGPSVVSCTEPTSTGPVHHRGLCVAIYHQVAQLSSHSPRHPLDRDWSDTFSTDEPSTNEYTSPLTTDKCAIVRAGDICIEPCRISHPPLYTIIEIAQTAVWVLYANAVVQRYFQMNICAIVPSDI